MKVQPFLAQVERRPLEVRTPGPRCSGVRRLAVVRHDRLGDVIVSLPAVAALRSAYPTAQLALVVRSAVAPLARMIGGVDRVIEIDAPAAQPLAALREFRADLVVCISRGLDAAWLAARAGIRERVGAGYRIYSGIFNRPVAERRRSGVRHEVEFALSFAHRVGAPTGPSVFPISHAPETRAEVRSWLSARGLRRRRFVLIHPGSGGSCPPWPPDRFVELARLLGEAEVDVVVSLGPADAAAARVFEAVPDGPRTIQRFTGDIPRLAALAKEAGLVVSNSTGPLHLAAALEVPTLGFYPPWPSCGPRRWGPYAGNGWALVAGCDEAMAWSRRRRRRQGAVLMRAIPPDVAARCALDLLGGRRPDLTARAG